MQNLSYGFATMRLTALIDRYVLTRPQSAKSEHLYRWVCRLLGEYLEREATTEDLTDDTVSRFLESREPHSSQWTMAGHRTRLLTLWRYAARTEGIRPPCDVRRESPPQPLPEAWTLGDIRKLVSACKELSEGGAYFKALILAAYETGLRRGDLFGLDRDDIGEDGRIWIRQSKTGQPHIPSMTPRTRELVLSLPGRFPLACRWGQKKYTQLWSQLRAKAGVSVGGCQKLRRTGATYVAKEYGTEAAREFLGHRSDEMVRHYIDRRIAERAIHRPPDVA